MNIKNEYIAIYELNNKSPLFARIASVEITKNNFEDAISILQDGIELYENYPTPYFLLGKLFLEIGNLDEAEECFQKGNSLLNYSKTFNFYRNSDFKNGEDKPEQLISDNKHDELQDLADALKNAKIKVNLDEDFSYSAPNVTNENENFLPPKGLVSETLASIYFDQSNYKEAKAIYNTLLEIQPDREEYFRLKIAEINARMRS
ncbi:MAG: hypothetical protein KKF62_11610 [Bacteroidetes bacterium]|nr:hypothetical protein [Bacteroidota bacterium]MBU1116013.1 hypothetical protein [Bacteroidota bacterium]MBU1799219.1 hypothetical protein [Bacteroidota bacterium]